MTDAIQKIINNENIEDVFSFAINNIFKYGPKEIYDLEILTYISIYHQDFFNQNVEKVLNYMGVFYKKNLQSTTLEEVVFGQYKKHIQHMWNNLYTPVQSKILYSIQNNNCYSFSAPTSTGKSHVFRKKILDTNKDVVIVVPSRALINEYLTVLTNLIEDKSINILPFIDNINTIRAKRNIFIVTPERCRELFKFKDTFNIDLFLFDEAQLSNEESSRGVFFDGIVRRAYKYFPNAIFVFAHPFVLNPEAQLTKNNLKNSNYSSDRFTQKNVGQIFFSYNKKNSSFFHFGINEKIMGTKKIISQFDPIQQVLQSNGSVLFYVSKASIIKNKIFTDFSKYINLCEPYPETLVQKYIYQLIEYSGGSPDSDDDYYSKLISYLKKGIVIHHGSLPLKIRSILEEFTKDGLCKICFATSTLEQGVNMPFDAVYLNRLEGSKPLSVKNLIGRAGRSTEKLKFDYGFIIVNSNSSSRFKKIMCQDEVLEEVSLLDIEEPDKDNDYNEFKMAIKDDSFSDEFNLTDSQLGKLTDSSLHNIIKELLDSFFHHNNVIPLEIINNDISNKLDIYKKFQLIYARYLQRNLNKAEELILNTAIKIIIWRIHGKTFKRICWYRYSYASKSNERRRLKNNGSSLSELTANYFSEFSEIPDKNLRAYNALDNTLAKDVDYDFIISDTYDYIDKLIGFRLSDIYYASFYHYYNNTQDKRALRLAKLIKYGTDNERYILMLRYGLTFEDIEVLDEHISDINTGEIKFKNSIYGLPSRFFEIVRRYV
nr:DEAD/DEAH box helicase [uncultured Sphingobacterium sp.]